ncbi:hypothetical protein SAMN05421541_112282 [Actinoplanes philippinensis]|uniref:Uncharacterized protein n=1 Tax=Actinoplanes philippinensis TaxID=35752 RepID=A0A1I2JI29_9ACTN|nr:hypothetical protein SAMN05421541_112282 [Actinoplanes philippinensis]
MVSETVVFSPEYAIAFSTRLVTAVANWLSLPYAMTPFGPS